MAVLLGALTFASVAGLVLAVGAVRSARAVRPSERLRRYSEATSSAAGGTGTRTGARSLGAALAKGLLARVGRVFEAGTYSRALEEELARADIALRGSEFVALNLLTLCGGLVAGSVLGRGNPLFLMVCVVVGAAGPSFWVRSAQRHRLARVNSQLADSLVIISNSLRAGYSFLQALDMVSHEMPPPISTEYARVLKEMNLGALAEQALGNLHRRVPSDDIDLVVTAVLIQRQVGGNLSEILDKISFTIRERVRIKGQIRTLTAMGRLSGLIVALLPVGLAVLLMGLNPSYMQLLFTHPLGRIMVVAGVAGELLGAYVISRIVRIDV